MTCESPPIYGSFWDNDVVFVQNWAGEILDNMHLVQGYQNLESCKKSIIFVADVDANFHLDITRKLIDQGNYVILTNLYECRETSFYDNIVVDLPDMASAPIINGSTTKSAETFGTETLLFRVYTYNNVNNARRILRTYGNQRPFTFLYLNGRHSESRIKLWNMLESQGLLENCLKSYLGYNVHPEHHDFYRAHLPDKYESKYARVDPESEVWKNSIRDYITWKRDAWQGQWIDGHLEPLARFNDTYFSLVTETVISTVDDMFVTEKTFKPLLAGHPFIILGKPGLYDYLHQLGFRTFAPVIDESFDQEPDLDRRIAMITAEVRRISQGNLMVFADECRPICQYNHNHYINLVHDKFGEISDALASWVAHHVNTAQSHFKQH